MNSSHRRQASRLLKCIPYHCTKQMLDSNFRHSHCPDSPAPATTTTSTTNKISIFFSLPSLFTGCRLEKSLLETVLLYLFIVDAICVVVASPRVHCKQFSVVFLSQVHYSINYASQLHLVLFCVFLRVKYYCDVHTRFIPAPYSLLLPFAACRLPACIINEVSKMEFQLNLSIEQPKITILCHHSFWACMLPTDPSHGTSRQNFIFIWASGRLGRFIKRLVARLVCWKWKKRK